MALNLPVQAAIDRSHGYQLYYSVETRIDDLDSDGNPDPKGEHLILLHALGGDAGHDPHDPPWVRCDHRSPVCVMPTPVLASVGPFFGSSRR